MKPVYKIDIFNTCITNKSYFLHAGLLLMFLLLSAVFFKINFFKKLFQKHYQNVKRFGSRSGPTFCRAWSRSKLFAKIMSRRQNSLLVGKGSPQSGLPCSYKLSLEVDQGKNKNMTPDPSEKQFYALSCIVCNFWSSNFRNKVSIFQEYSKNTQIQVNILPFS